MTGNNPISGMTLITLIMGSSALVAVGLQGSFGKYAAIYGRRGFAPRSR